MEIERARHGGMVGRGDSRDEERKSMFYIGDRDEGETEKAHAKGWRTGVCV